MTQDSFVRSSHVSLCNKRPQPMSSKFCALCSEFQSPERAVGLTVGFNQQKLPMTKLRNKTRKSTILTCFNIVLEVFVGVIRQ